MPAYKKSPAGLETYQKVFVTFEMTITIKVMLACHTNIYGRINIGSKGEKTCPSIQLTRLLQTLVLKSQLFSS